MLLKGWMLLSSYPDVNDPWCTLGAWDGHRLEEHSASRENVDPIQHLHVLAVLNSNNPIRDT